MLSCAQELESVHSRSAAMVKWLRLVKRILIQTCSGQFRRNHRQQEPNKRMLALSGQISDVEIMRNAVARKLRLAGLAIAVLLGLGYFSNGMVIRHLSARSSGVRDKENRRLLSQAVKWQKKDERHSYIRSRYWRGPRMDVTYTAWIPFIVTTRYNFETPFDVEQMGGYGYVERTMGICVPLKSWKCSIYIH
jgi:hypothetical protein